MRAEEDSDGVWLDRLSLRYGFRDKSTLLRDLRDIRRRIQDAALAERFLDLVARRIGETNVPVLALTSLDRLLGSVHEPDRIVQEWYDDPDRFLELLKLLGTTPFVAKLVMAHHEPYRTIAVEEFPDRESLAARVWEQLSQLDSEKSVATALHRIRGLWTLRIAADDLLREHDVQTITSRISDLADACLDGALRWALDRRAARTGRPLKSSGEPCRIAAMSLGKLGGCEINYSSDVDLIFLYDDEGRTDRGPAESAVDHFGRVIGDFLKIMAGAGCSPAILRVDLRLRPEGSQGPILMTLDQTLNYYDSAGRTWERQALIKLRPCAGDLELGGSFVKLIEPFVYRRYLSAVEIAEIQAMKRRIENRAKSEGVSLRDVKTGYGGIRDVEFVVQFLQLLNGCTLPTVRGANTIRSLHSLKSAGCLTPVEHETLLRNYVFLRKTEHRLQLEQDRQTHRIPERPDSRRILALLMGFSPMNAWESPEGPFERFLLQYVKSTEENNGVLNRLLHDAFRTDDSSRADPVSDLILDPEMPTEVQDRILNSFGLSDKPRAIRHLEFMAREEKPYFSTPRCRHFFAAIAPKLLQKVSATPDPDAALAQIDSISRVLPVKALLWESLSSRTQALDAFVRVASENRFVADSILSRPRLWEHWYRHTTGELMEMPDPSVDAEKGKQPITSNRLLALREKRDDLWLAIAARHHLPLSVDSVRDMGREVSLVADRTIQEIARTLWNDPAHTVNSRLSQSPGKWAILALGKAGAQSLAFHSDLDLVFVHEIDVDSVSAKEKIAAERYFEELAGRFVRSCSERGAVFLYRVDTRLRPFGAAGSLSVPVESLRSYYRTGEARVWERLALLRARPVFVQGFEVDSLQKELVRLALDGRPDEDRIRKELSAVRSRSLRAIESCPDDLKRCDGGSQAIELFLQALQLNHTPLEETAVIRDEWDAIRQIESLGLLTSAQAESLTDAYSLYRQIDWALRLYRNRSPEYLRIEPKEMRFIERMIRMQDGSAAPDQLTITLGRLKASVQEIIGGFLADRSSA